MITMIDRIRDKTIRYESTRANKARYLILSTPPALELLYNVNSKLLVGDKLKSPRDLERGELFGLKVIVLDTNKEIVEVG